MQLIKIIILALIYLYNQLLLNVPTCNVWPLSIFLQGAELQLPPPLLHILVVSKGVTVEVPYPIQF